MLRVSRLSNGARVTDDAKNVVRFHADRWTEVESGEVDVSIAETLDGHDVGPDDPSVVIAGRAERLEFPPVFVAAIPLTGGEQTGFGGQPTEVALPADEYLLRIDANVRVFLRVNGSLELHRETGELVRVAFPERTTVELAFASRVDLPDGTVTVPRTPAGVARGLSTLSAGTDTQNPDRTWPTMRGRAPLVEFGEETQVPAAVAEEVESTGVEILTRPTVEELVPVASLAYYLGADVRVESDAEPHVAADGLRWSLADGRSISQRASELLRRTFYLDCVARGAGPHGGRLSVAETFDTLGLDAERLYDAPLAERLRTYVETDFDAVSDQFPEWHLTMHVAPTFENAATLPYLVDNVPFLVPPRGERIDEQEWLELSLTGDGFTDPVEAQRSFRAGSGYGRRDVSNIDLLKPELGPGRTHGWLADGVPIDAFKARPEAYRHRDEALDDPGEQLSVTAVVNETGVGRIAFGEDDGLDMHDEHAAAVDHYEERAEELNVEIDVRENVSTHELARIFESHNDFVHFIGHHEDCGLGCPDGYLSAESLDRSRARSFFLNACGSYPFGETLIEKGSVAGGVTFASVSDDDAAEVGTTFARLLMLGYCIDRGLATAARHAIAPRDYAVIGDGTFAPSQSDAFVPKDNYIIPFGKREFRIMRRQNTPQECGVESATPVADVSKYRLDGEMEVFQLNKHKVIDYFGTFDEPVFLERELIWPSELKNRLE